MGRGAEMLQSPVVEGEVTGNDGGEIESFWSVEQRINFGFGMFMILWRLLPK